MSKPDPTLIYYMERRVSHIRYPEAVPIRRLMELYLVQGKTLEVLEYGFIPPELLDARLAYWAEQILTLESDR